MDYNKNDIDFLLQKWNTTKEEISSLEKKLDKYKKYAEHIMTQENLTQLSNNEYTLTKTEMNRTVLAKEDVPKEIWFKYSKNISYNMFTLRKRKETNGEKKLKKSRKHMRSL